MTPRPKRGYSYAFKATTERDVFIGLRRIPIGLKRKFMARCRREGVSMRHQLLRWIRNWGAERSPDDDGTEPDASPPPTNGPYEETGKIW